MCRQSGLRTLTINLGRKVDQNQSGSPARLSVNCSGSDDDDGVAPLCASMESMANVTDSPNQATASNVFRRQLNYAEQMKTPSELVSTACNEPIVNRGHSFRKSINAECTPHESEHSVSARSDKENSVDRPKAKTSLTFTEPIISTKSFYGTSSSSSTWSRKFENEASRSPYPTHSIVPKLKLKTISHKTIQRPKVPMLWQGRGAFKPIRYKHHSNRRQKKQAKTISSSSEAASTSIESIDGGSAKKVSRKDDESPPNQFHRKVMLNGQSSLSPWESSKQSAIKRPREVNVESAEDGSDESGDENDPLLHVNLLDNITPTDAIDDGRSARKFFKSKRDDVAKKYRIVNAFSATLKRGNNMKLEVPAKRVKKNKGEFSFESHRAINLPKNCIDYSNCLFSASQQNHEYHRFTFVALKSQSRANCCAD